MELKVLLLAKKENQSLMVGQSKMKSWFFDARREYSILKSYYPHAVTNLVNNILHIILKSHSSFLLISSPDELSTISYIRLAYY